MIKTITEPNNQYTRLAFLHARLYDEGMEPLMEALKSPNCRIESLSLNDHRITDRGVQVIANAIPLTPVVELHLAGNPIESAVALARMLEQPGCKLEILDVARTAMADDGVLMLAHALSRCRVQDIGVNYNRDDKKATKTLWNVLSSVRCCVVDARLNDSYDNMILYMRPDIKRATMILRLLQLRDVENRHIGRLPIELLEIIRVYAASEYALADMAPIFDLNLRPFDGRNPANTPGPRA